MDGDGAFTDQRNPLNKDATAASTNHKSSLSDGSEYETTVTVACTTDVESSVNPLNAAASEALVLSNVDEHSKSLSSLVKDGHEKSIDSVVPDMWSRDFIGLYCQYAAVGLLYGTSGALTPFCFYHFEGEGNVCSNSKNIVNFAWNLKIFYAIGCDSFRPFGMRRKPYMIAGWIGVLILLLVLTISADKINLSSWLVLLMFVQIFVMLSDVPGDGYSVELGQLESADQRGQILATGQRVRFFFCIVAGVIQTFLLNGPTTNSSGCPIAWDQCWSWGLTINGYYGLLFAMVFILTIPILWLKELDGTNVPRHTLSESLHSLWFLLKNLTTFYLLIYVIGIQALTNFTSNVNVYVQYSIIKLTSFQAGIDTITTYSSLVLAIWLFQKYMINRNWRITQYCSVFLASGLGLVWITTYYNVGGLMNPWFTIFIDLDTYFAQGLSQVLYSMAVIELSAPGMESSSYELLVTCGNSASFVNGIVSTQLLTPTNTASCSSDDGGCSANSVCTTDKHCFDDSDGPWRYTQYCLIISSISIGACLLFTPFLPKSKEQCHEWRAIGEQAGESVTRAKIALLIVVVVIAYGVVAAILLLSTKTSCLAEVGGTGC